MNVSDKLVRFARVLNVIGKVLAALCLLAAVSMLGSAVFMALLPENLLHDVLDRVELTSSLGIFSANTTLGTVFPQAALTGVKIGLILLCLNLMLYAAVSAIILFILNALFKSTALKRSPFLPENIKRLKIIGVILIVAAVLLNLNNLIFAFCVLALAYVFQYGAELQRQADETL